MAKKITVKKAAKNGNGKSTALAQWGAGNAVNVDFDKMMRAAQQSGSTLEESSIAAKEKLVGVPFVIAAVTVRQGSFGRYLSAECVTKHNQHVILNDGSTGIFKQLVGDNNELTTKLPLLVPGGLRASDYESEWGPARTYYLSGRTELQA